MGAPRILGVMVVREPWRHGVESQISQNKADFDATPVSAASPPLPPGPQGSEQPQPPATLPGRGASPGPSPRAATGGAASVLSALRPAQPGLRKRHLPAAPCPPPAGAEPVVRGGPGRALPLPLPPGPAAAAARAMAPLPPPLLLLLLVPALPALPAASAGPAPPRSIAVVGAGLGGAAVAYFSQQQFGPQVQLDVYEQAGVGGRLATVTVNKQQYESGTASIHALSLHMQDFVKTLGLKQRREVPGKSAIFSGEHFVLEETDWYLLNLFRLWWHYGISFLRLQMWVEEVMEKFMRIYKYQAHGYAFSSLEELLRSLGGDAFINMTQRSVAESLLEVGVTQRFVDDVIAAVLRSSYGQSVLVPAFAGAMSLAGAQGSMWAVEGGNKLVCSGLLKLTKANVIPARVTGISLHSSEGRALYQVHYEGSKGQGSSFYDMVVVTTPLHTSRSNFTFENFEPPIANFPRAFQPSVTSVVHGYLNSSYFGFPDPKLFPFASILTTDTPDLFFNAMDNICPVNISVAFRRKQPQEAAVWRVLSQQPLDKQQLKTLFRSYYSVQVTEWQSYPRYDSTKSLPPIVLHDNLFYLSGVEWVASSMEMIAVAAKNVALLAYNRWYQDLEKIDQKDLMHKVKTEL
ncbi:prenylcysteine oxidase 1-like isoform X1 [Anas platyrhynchos]|uniref:prenylcysteine oxidase 1-like isoform X1 n=1 Tax=Anas platyrhynchos TaxID=8839 RepID=UPI003AF2EAA1